MLAQQSDARILVCEDEPEVSSFVHDALVAVGYQVDTVANGNDAMVAICKASHDAVILDIMLPDRDGLSVLREARIQGIHVPVILLTARFRVEDRIEGLDAGANDYLVKPFALGELLARVRVLLRKTPEPDSTIAHDGLFLNVSTRRVTYNDRLVFLSVTEFSLLHFLLRNRGRVVPRTEILHEVWGDDGFRSTNIVEVYINYLRSKIAPGLIRTVRGHGYILGRLDDH